MKNFKIIATLIATMTLGQVAFGSTDKNIRDYYYELSDNILMGDWDKEYEPTDRAAREENLSWRSTVDLDNYYIKFTPLWLDGSASMTMFLQPDGEHVLIQEVRGCGPMCIQDLYYHKLIDGNWTKIPPLLPELPAILDRSESLMPDVEKAIEYLKQDWESTLFGEAGDEFKYSLIYELPRGGTTVKLNDQYSQKTVYEFEWANGRFTPHLATTAQNTATTEVEETTKKQIADISEEVAEEEIIEKTSHVEIKEAKIVNQSRKIMKKETMRVVNIIFALLFAFYIPFRMFRSMANIKINHHGFYLVAMTWILTSRIGIFMGVNHEAFFTQIIRFLIRPFDYIIGFITYQTAEKFYNAGDVIIKIFALSPIPLIISDIIFLGLSAYIVSRIMKKPEKEQKSKLKIFMIINIALIILTDIVLIIRHGMQILYGLSGI